MILKLRVVVYLLVLIIPFSGLSQNIDSLNNIISKSQSDSAKIEACWQLADFYYYDNPDTAIFYYTKAIEIGKKTELQSLLFNTQTYLFNLFIDQSNYFSAKQIAIDALLTAETINDSLLISQAHSNMGNLYMYIELNDKALSHLLQAIKIYPIETNPAEIGKLYGRLGNLYLFIEDFDDAEKSYLKAIEFFKQQNVQRGIIISTQNLGIIEKRKKNFDKALEYYTDALNGYTELKNTLGVAQCMANMGNIYIEKKEYYKALSNFHAALKIFIDQKQIIDEIVCYSEIANLYFKIKKFDLAFDYISKANDRSKLLPDNTGTQLSILYQLQEIYAASGDSSNAYKYLKDYQVLNDTLVNQNSQRRIETLKMQYDFEQKEKDIQLLTIENELKETELKRKSVFQILYLVFIGMAIFALSVLFFLFRLKRKANIALEHKNAEIMQQKEEIESQRDEIEAQRDMVYGQKIDLEIIHSKISQSIEYAQIIQSSILPDPEILKERVSDFFVFYKPKDVVSGDFYWWANVENNTVITAVDCTGHGVPGAFMSMLGISFLREIVMKEYITHPGVILRKLRKEIVKSLNQKDELGAPRDGMDMALISINHETNMMEFAGAHNPVYIISKTIQKPDNKSFQLYTLDGVDEKLLEIKPDKMPIAIYHRMDSFTNQEIQLQKGDQIYMFSDGYVDQFGGEDKKRFMNGAFRELLLKIANKPMETQKEIIENTFEFWKGDTEQIDDIVVVGIKI